MNPGRSLLFIAALFCAAMTMLPAQAADLRIATAANFTGTLKKLVALYEQQSGYTTAVSTGSTGKLYAQIVNGAPFDIFLAADSRRPKLLEDANLTLPGSRETYAIGKLALWSASGLLKDANSFPDIDSIGYLAIANPRLAPYGVAARQALESMGLWKAVSPKLVRGESISQAYQFAASGNATAGFIAASQIPYGNGSHWLIPEHLHQPLEHQLVILNDRPAAAKFVAFLDSTEARRLIEASGYSVPGDED